MGLIDDRYVRHCRFSILSSYFRLSWLSIKASTRLALLRRAIQTHTRLSRSAATGRGIDRHLLGLRLMMRPDDGERAELFEDPLFERSQEWKLSTSALSAGELFRGTGYVIPAFILHFVGVIEMRAEVSNV